MIYLPVGKQVLVNTTFMKAMAVTAWWFNPKEASVQKIGTLNRTKLMQIMPPVTGVENDWGLIIDDAGKKYEAPLNRP